MADADVGVPPIGGDDLTCRLFMNNSRFGEDLIVSVKFSPKSKVYEDKHIGNKVFKLDYRVFGWKGDLSYDYKTDKMVAAYLAFINAKMTPGSAPVNVGLFFAVQQRDAAAAKPGYLFSPVVFDLDINAPGLDERIRQGVSFHAEQFKPMVVSG